MTVTKKHIIRHLGSYDTFLVSRSRVSNVSIKKRNQSWFQERSRENMSLKQFLLPEYVKPKQTMKKNNYVQRLGANMKKLEITGIIWVNK